MWVSAPPLRPLAPTSPPPSLPAPAPPLLNVGNTVHELAPYRSLSLIGVPPRELDKLASALQRGPIDGDFLAELIAGDFHATDMAKPMAHALVEAALPGLLPASLGIDANERAAWTATLVHALILPAERWEVECLIDRPALSAHAASSSPLLRQLRNALYRPLYLSRNQWRAELARARIARPDSDSADVARALQDKRLPADRRRWARDELARLAPHGGGDTEHIHAFAARDGGLIEPRIALPAIFAQAGPKTLDSTVAHAYAYLAGLGGLQPKRPSTLPHTTLAKKLLRIGQRANVERPPATRPIGNYSSVAHALTSLLYAPGQLPFLREAGAALWRGHARAGALTEEHAPSMPAPVAGFTLFPGADATEMHITAGTPALDLSPLAWLESMSDEHFYGAIDVALGMHRPAPGLVDLDTRCAIAASVLEHLLGADSTFPATTTASTWAKVEAAESLLWNLYHGARTRELIGSVLNIDEQETKHTTWPALSHAFFGRLSVLDTLSSTNGQQILREVLQDSLIPVGGANPASNRLQHAYPQVTNQLMPWMVMFQRGRQTGSLAREWVDDLSGEALFQLAYPHPDADPITTWATDLGKVFAQATSHYDDDHMLGVLSSGFESFDAWWLVSKGLCGQFANLDHIALDMSLPISVATRMRYARKITEHVVAQAIGNHSIAALEHAGSAENRILSLAIDLRAWLRPDDRATALMMAALLLAPLPPIANGTEPNTGTPDLHEWLTLPDAHVEAALRHGQPRGIDFVSKADTVLNLLGFAVFSGQEDGRTRLTIEPYEAWRELAKTARFAHFGQALLRAQDWYGAADGETTTPAITRKLAMQAISTYLFPALGRRPGVLFKHNFWSASALELTHAQLNRRARRAITRAFPGAAAPAIELTAGLLVSQVAPELHVHDVPAHIRGRSLQGVSFHHGVALCEAIAPGSSVGRNFAELAALPARIAADVDPAVQDIWVRTLVVPALRYAIAHDVVGCADVQSASADDIASAMRFLHEQQTSHAHDLQMLHTAAPDRRWLAENVLAEAQVERRYWNKIPYGKDTWVHLKHAGAMQASSYAWDRALGNPAQSMGGVGDPAVKAMRPTLVELVMMGEVNFSTDTTVPEQFDKAYRQYVESMQLALANIVSRLLAELPSAERKLLRWSTCEVSRVCFDGVESYQGAFLRCQQGYHAEDFSTHAAHEIYYEIFPFAGIVRRVEQAFGYIQPRERRYIPPEVIVAPHQVEEAAARQAAEQHRKSVETARITPLRPFDSDAYLHGAVSRAADAVHTPRHATLIPRTPLLFRTAANAGLELVNIATAVADHLIAQQLADAKQQATHATDWEELWRSERKAADRVARMLVPFYACARDMADGDRSSSAIAGCAMDGLFALIPAGEFFGSTARVVSRAGRMTVRAIGEDMVTATARLTTGIAALSPVAIVPDLWHGGRLLTQAAWNQLRELSAIKSMFGHMPRGEYALHGAAYTVPPAARGAWHPRHPGDMLAKLHEQTDVLVRKVDAGAVHLVEPDSGFPYGPALVRIADDGQLGRIDELPRELPLDTEPGGWSFHDPAPGLTLAWYQRGEQLLLDVGDVTYRKVQLDDGTALLRRSDDAHSGADDLVAFHCRSRRTLPLSACSPTTYVNRGYRDETGLIESDSVDMPAWFSDRRLSIDAGKKTFVHNGKLMEAGGMKPKITGQVNKQCYKATITAQLGVGNRMYRRASIGSIVDGIDDAREISAIVVTRRSNGERVMFTHADDGIYYKGTIPADACQGSQITMERVDYDVDVVHGLKTLDLAAPEHENSLLVLIYVGSENACQRLKQLGAEKINSDLANIRADITDGRIDPIVKLVQEGPFELTTTPERSALFCRYAQANIVSTIKNEATHWAPISQATPLAERELIANTLNQLLLAPGRFDATRVLDADVIKPSVTFFMNKSRQKVKNLAFTIVTFKDPAQTPLVLYSLSGVRNENMALPLAQAHTLPAGWQRQGATLIADDGARFVNVQPETPPAVEPSSPVNTRDPNGGMVFVPDPARPTSIDEAGDNFRFTDSERNIASWILNFEDRPGHRAIDPDDIAELFTYSTRPVCQSCTYGFGQLRNAIPKARFTVHEGPAQGELAANVVAGT